MRNTSFLTGLLAAALLAQAPVAALAGDKGSDWDGAQT